MWGQPQIIEPMIIILSLIKYKLCCEKVDRNAQEGSKIQNQLHYITIIIVMGCVHTMSNYMSGYNIGFQRRSTNPLLPGHITVLTSRLACIKSLPNKLSLKQRHHSTQDLLNIFCYKHSYRLTGLQQPCCFQPVLCV